MTRRQHSKTTLGGSNRRRYFLDDSLYDEVERRMIIFWKDGSVSKFSESYLELEGLYLPSGWHLGSDGFFGNGTN